MKTESSVALQAELPGGANFLRCALQVNPGHYAQTYRGEKSPGVDGDTYIAGLLAKARELDVRVLAITDHNHVGSIDAFRAAAKGTSTCIFPSFEVTSQEGIYVLCIYDVDTPVATLERYLGALGVHDTSPNAAPANQPFTAVLQTVKEQGGITIAAHATQSGGLFDKLEGQPRIRAWCDENLLAIQIPGAIDGLPHDVKQIVRNKNPHYRRKSPADASLALAVVNAKDVSTPDDLSDPAATCWIKMSQPSLEALRQAFLDPISRIRLNSDPAPEEHAEVSEISWEGGFLGNGRIIVDQPEDDLDNRFVTDTIVPKMREEKRRRQFIFATHNANIPVLGDAEQIIGLSPVGETVGDGAAKLRPEHMGSIDSRAVREMVEEVLEGGKEAFERRRAKYGF